MLLFTFKAIVARHCVIISCLPFDSYDIFPAYKLDRAYGCVPSVYMYIRVGDVFTVFTVVVYSVRTVFAYECVRSRIYE